MCAWLRTYPYHSYVLLSAIWSIWKKPVCWDSFGSSTTDLSCFNLEKLQEPSGTTSRAVQTPSAPKSLMNSPELTNATLRAHKVVLYSHPSPSSSCQSTGKQHSVPFSLRHHSKCAHVNLTFSDIPITHSLTPTGKGNSTIYIHSGQVMKQSNVKNLKRVTYFKTCIGLPWWLSGKGSVCQCRGHRFDPGSGKNPTCHGAARSVRENYWRLPA